MTNEELEKQEYLIRGFYRELTRLELERHNGGRVNNSLAVLKMKTLCLLSTDSDAIALPPTEERKKLVLTDAASIVHCIDIRVEQHFGRYVSFSFGDD